MSEHSKRLSQGRGNLAEVAQLFLKLGLIAFGGPAAHIAMMEEEVVTRRQWISRQHFLDLVGATNLIPGPNSSEMTMHIGYERAGWKGLITSGSLFILPAALMTGVLAWAYSTFGTLPAIEPFLIGIKPAVIAVILAAVWRLGKKAVKSWSLVMIGVLIAVAVLLGVGELSALFGGSAVGTLWLWWQQRKPTSAKRVTSVGLLWLPSTWKSMVPWDWASLLGYANFQTVAVDVTLWRLALVFLKIGAVLYGSGYVLIAFLEGDLVQNYGWLTQEQLLDAVAVGQFTPGPVLTTATFIGYLVAGVPGAIVATLCIFLPSFVFVAILNPVVPRLRQSTWTAAFLDAVNVAAIALMVAVTINLARTTLVSWQTWLIAILASLAVLRWNVNAAWLVLGGAILGYVLYLVG